MTNFRHGAEKEKELEEAQQEHASSADTISDLEAKVEAASQALAQAESGKQQQQAHISELEAQAQSFRAERARIQEEIEDEKGVILTHVAVWHGIKQMLSRFGPEGGAPAACCYTCAT